MEDPHNNERIFANRYHIQSLLSRQAGRRTFLALDLQTRQTVVLKLLLFGVDFTWDDLKLFEREAEVLKSLDLPAIPKYLDYFDVDTESGKGFVLVQTYIEAKSLQYWLDAGRTFSEAELIEIAISVLTILNYLHSRQPAVIHRDIKPSNILLGDRSGFSPGEAYLVDFGSVKTAAVDDGTITVVGTYGYMPPEQFGGQTTPASDLYALGATLICLATGKHPSQLPQKDMQIVFTDALSNRSRQQVNLTPHFTNWLKWMTAPSLDSRLKSANEALLALDRSSQLGKETSLTSKPFNSRIKVNKTSEMLEITILPVGFRLGFGEIFLIVFFYLSMAFVQMLLWVFAFLTLPLLAIISWRIFRDTIFDLTRTQVVRVTTSNISISSKFLGLKLSHFVATRKHISKIEIIPITSYVGNDTMGSIGYHPSQLNIWVGTKKIDIDSKDRLTSLEKDWLLNELSDWMNLPSSKAI
jgi:serine/threonine protein kinase